MKSHFRPGFGLATKVILLLSFLLPTAVFAATGFDGIRTFAPVPADPGFPEGVAVDGNHVYVSGPARFGTAGTGPSTIQVYDRNTHDLETTIEVAGEALAFEHALSNIAIDADGRIYALSTQLGLIRFTQMGTGAYVQDSYGDPLPDLPTCTAVPGGPCSPTFIDMPPIVNDVIFDAAGNAYVTDSLQATIFRYAPGGGAPEIWFQSDQFEGGGFIPFGLNGLRLSPDRSEVYIVTSTSFANPALGTIYTLPLVDSPDVADLEIFHQYVGGELPDQLAFGEYGELYVTLALSNQISVLAADGTELSRIQSAPGEEIALDAPAGIAFNSRDKTLLIVNHALLTGNPASFAVLEVYTDDAGDPLEKPSLP